MARKVIQACGGSVRDKIIAVLGLTFKPNTDDMREAPSIAIVTALEDAGAKVRGFDPEGMSNARIVLPGLELADSAYACIKGADAMVIVTEWNEFRALDMRRVKDLMRSSIIVDLRNIYRADDLTNLGFTYSSVGRPQRTVE
jgi:UDPglucose 6-dehydrogenase